LDFESKSGQDYQDRSPLFVISFENRRRIQLAIGQFNAQIANSLDRNPVVPPSSNLDSRLPIRRFWLKIKRVLSFFNQVTRVCPPISTHSLPMPRLFLVSSICCLASLSVTPTQADEPTPKQLKFFETKIRPVLSDNCFECHAKDKQESDLRLDSRAAIIRGGASGSAVNTDDPDASLLLEVLQYGGDVEMPPDQKLDDEVIENIRTWIEMGLPWPKPKKNATAEATFQTMEQRLEKHRDSHWAFQPLLKRPSPQPGRLSVETAYHPANPIDQLIQAKLYKQNLKPSPEATRPKLTRRLYLTLLGLPPTYEEVQQVINDPRPDWYQQLVDRLLTSPRYGERWGRHWLDVARYADTRGYAFNRDRNYPHAYTYRDYVVNAWNDDKPFDRFVMEQLAADQLELGDDLRPLAGLGFLTVGRKFNNPHDDIDDKIDVVFRGLQGLTVACARCHDHKYDAIPTKDYYSLYGVFASTREGALPYIGHRQEVEAFQAQKSELDVVQNQLNQFLNNQRQAIVDSARSHTEIYLAHVLKIDPTKIQQLAERHSPAPTVIPKIVRAWRDYIRGQANDSHPVWFPWKALTALPANDQFQSQADQLIQSWKEPNRKINPLLLAELEKTRPANRLDIARIYGKVISNVYQAWKKAGSNDRGLAKLSEAQRQIGIALFTDRTPTEIKTENIVAYLDDEAKQRHHDLTQQVARKKQQLPPELDRAMVVSDISQPVEPVVFIRGQAGRRGDRVPRQFIEVLSEENRKPFSQGAGRLELASHITDPDNPLTARVIANRIWMRLMGSSLVATPSDFGTRCPEPLHRDVLDYLAGYLIDQEWSIKALQREILTSATFRQSSQDRSSAAELDVTNEFYWRANRQRLEFEPLRDSMLFASGELDLAMGGKSVRMTQKPYSKRRAVYGYIDRQDLPNLLRAFDFASPDQSSAQRTQTTVPQQLLFLMNSPFVIQRAQKVADQVSPDLSPNQVAHQLYQKILARDPQPREVGIAKNYLESQKSNEDRVRNLAQILLLTNEFTYVD
jgi:hypothetical protein